MFAGEEPLGAFLSPTLPSLCLPFVLVTGTDLNIGTGGRSGRAILHRVTHSDVRWSLALPQSDQNKFYGIAGFQVRSPGRSGRAILYRVTLTFIGRTGVWHCHRSRAIRTSSVALQGFQVRSPGRSGRAILHRVTLTFTGRTRVWHCHGAIRTSSVALQGFQVRSLGRSDRAILHRITLTFTGVWYCHRAVGTSLALPQSSRNKFGTAIEQSEQVLWHCRGPRFDPHPTLPGPKRCADFFV